MKQALVIAAIATGFNVLDVPKQPSQLGRAAISDAPITLAAGRPQPDDQQCWFDPDLPRCE